MKYYFIINPVTGTSDKTEILSREIKKVFLSHLEEDFEIYVTKYAGDGERYVKEIASKLTEDTVFLACGGDGTSYEVLNGLVKYPHAIMGTIAIGSCNDFLKCFPNYDFRSIEKLFYGTPKVIDVINCNDRYSLNVINIGYDATTNDDCNKIKARTRNVKTAYTRSIIKNLLLKKTHHVNISVDGKELYQGKMFLMTFSNGEYYGGGYHTAPRAIVDDGLMEIMVVKNLSRFTFIRLIKDYRNGTHLDNKKFNKYIIYARGKHLDIELDKQVCVCIDGEITYATTLDIQIEHEQIRFLIPGE